MLQGVRPAFIFCVAALSVSVPRTFANQSPGNAGTLIGTVTDPTGASIPDAAVVILNPVSGHTQTCQTGQDGAYRLINIPVNNYHLSIKAPGFTDFEQDVTLRNPLPVRVDAKLMLANAAVTSVTVEAGGTDLIETDPSAHTDVDRKELAMLPTFDPGGGLNQAITAETGGVVADSNGGFHPVGDHGQTTYVIDGEPIGDQQSKVFSTQLPTSAVQSMELGTGAPSAEFGDKTSLVAQVTTRSGLGAMRQFGSAETFYGAFGSTGGDVSWGFGNEKVGNFLALDGTRSSRFLDSPEFTPFHDVGNNETIFDRFDYQPDGNDVFHLNVFLARNWIQIPNSYDQLTQDQRQRVLTWNVAPGYQHTFNPHMLLTVNPYARKDQFNYYPSRNPFDDTPSTQSQSRQLFDLGVRSDLAINYGRHNIKIGLDIKQTRLIESFDFGITDPALNSVCNDANGAAITSPSIDNPNTCQVLGYTPNPNFQVGLLPFDLSRGGSLFQYRATHNINEYGFYIQDGITLGHWLVNVGLRGDMYYGLTSASAAEPRAGVAYNFKKTSTVLRAAYSRTFETPFNENLLLSSASGLTNGVAQAVLGASSTPAIQPGRRNQFNVGMQQAVGKYLVIDADYFWKYTTNAFDFSVLQNSTITFPISWAKSKLDGVTGRVSSTNLHGFVTYWNFGHTRARYFPPQSGGLLNTTSVPPGVFRIDHDQAFQSTFVSRYQRPKNAEYIEFLWRYDSGEVVSGVPDVQAATLLTPAQQVDIGFACNGVFANLAAPITSCSGKGTSTLITLPQTGTENNDYNPDRVKPRNTFDMSVGSDNLLHREGNRRFTATVQVENLTDKVALYNFLSTFSGTHFLQPRTVVGKIGFVF